MAFMHSQVISPTPAAVPGRRIIAGVLLINLFFLGLTALWLKTSYEHYEERAIIASQNLAGLLSQQILGEVERIDLAISVIADEAIREQQAGGIDNAFLSAFLARQKERLPFLESLRVTDKDGFSRYGSDSDPLANVSLADREYFIRLRDDPKAGLVISKPLLGRVSKKWVVIFARRLTAPDGSFAGIVLAPLPVKHFNDSFSILALGANGIAVLRSIDDWGLVARFPAVETYGQTFVSQKFRKNIEANPLSGTYMAYAASDNIERIFTYRRIGNQPLVALIGMGTDDYVAEWRHEAEEAGLLVVLFALASLVAARIISAAWRSRTEATEQFQSLLASAGVGIFGIDLAGKCTFCNSSALRMFGLETEEQTLGQSLHQLCHHSHIDGSPYPEKDCRVFSTIRSGEPCRGDDEHYWRADGTYFPVEYWSHPQRRGGKLVGAVVTFADITERRASAQALSEKTRELARSNTDLEQFAYVASHDLREPLRMVASYVALLERRMEPVLTDDTREFLAFAKDGAKRMDRLIIDLLEYSRIGRNRPPMTEVSMAEVMEGVLANLDVAIKDAQATVVVADDLPSVTGDHGELVRLMQNLLGNAIKYRAPETPPLIEVYAVRLSHGWEFAVTDNGIGIPEDQQERVFGIFQRLHGRGEYEGTGIGLAICRKIVEHHDGRLWVESHAGKGSIFRFTLGQTHHS